MEEETETGQPGRPAQDSPGEESRPGLAEHSPATLRENSLAIAPENSLAVAPERDLDTRPDHDAGIARGTGEPRVDAALRLLDRLPGLPVSDHPELFELVHAQLTDVLGELDSGPEGPADQRGN
jgi:hypothetical protein